MRRRDAVRNIAICPWKTIFIDAFHKYIGAPRSAFTQHASITHCIAHRALCSVATTIAAREMSTFSSAKSILFQRHAALLVTNNALCLMSGLLSGI